MVRRALGSIERQPLFGHAQRDLDCDVRVFADLKGTSGDDDIKGTDGDDTIKGLAGDDMLKGLGGDDVIHGGDGNDKVFGGDGDDTLYGDEGYNEVRGGEGNDHIIGGKTYDSIYGGIGENVIDTSNRSSVYTIAGGIDHVMAARYWYVDYSELSESINISNNGRDFSNGSSISQVTSFRYILGSGNDSFVCKEISNRDSEVDAGGGSDYFELVNTTKSYLPLTISRGSDGKATLSLYSSNGNYVYSQYKSFENIHIVSHRYVTFLSIDGSLLYQGLHVDLDVYARYSIDFLTYDGQVTALYDAGVLTINGSTIRGSANYTIRLNDQDGHVTAGGTITGGAGNDSLTGLAGHDLIAGNGGDDTIDGAGGDDFLSGGNGDDTISGGTGNDQITDTVGSNTIYGGDGHDAVTTGDGADTIDGGADTDTIVAGNGHNVVDGGEGDDTITGGDGADELSGSGGIDRIDGGAGHNVLNGGDGDDILNSTYGAIDGVDGGTGNDRWSGGDGGSMALTVTWDGGLHVSNGIEVVNVETVGFYLGSGNDRVAVSAKAIGTLTLAAGAGVDTIDYSALKGGGITLSLSETDVQATGGGGSQQITGFENLIGTAKNDALTGTADDNLMTGGEGADALTGGAGADTFIYTALADLGKKANIDKIDRITDFTHTEGDKIDLRAIDADLKTDGDQAFKFVGTDAFTIGGNGPGEIRYSQSIDGYLLVQGDINHDGKADLSLLVHNTALVASDLLL